MGFLAVRADEATSDLITFDLQELDTATIKLANHAIKLASLGFGTTFLKWVASYAAILAMHEESSSRRKVDDDVHEGAVPAYLLDR